MGDESFANSKSSAPNGSNLQFVSFTNPSDCHASDVKHAIRSHVTRYQHRHRQPRSPESSKTKKSKPSSKARQTSPEAPSEPGADQDPPSRGSPRTPAELAPYSRLLGATLLRAKNNQVNYPIAECEKTSAVFLVWNPNSAENSLVKGMYVDTWQILGDALPIFDGDHSLGCDNPSQDPTQGCFYTLAAEDSASYSAAVLLVASHISHLLGQDIQSTEILRLREAAMENLQLAVRTSKGQISEPLIIAVTLLGVYERLYGQEESFAVHLQGLADMIHLRGGITQFGMTGTFNRLVLLFDDELDCADLLSRMTLSDLGYFENLHYR